MSAATPLFEVRQLAVELRADGVARRLVDGVDLHLMRGEVLGIVGESGSGKTLSVLATLGLAPRGMRVTGEARFGGRDLLSLPEEELRRVRGNEIAVVFQDPMTSLNPAFRVGWQIEEQVRIHTGASRRAARARAVELLDLVGIVAPAVRARQYPHELSGGMRQRAMIAMALSCDPSVIIADEPTTALDTTTQAQILALLGRIATEFDGGIVLISHDLGVIAELADRAAVMYAGRVVETAPSGELFAAPQHPYTWGLLASIPRIDRDPPRRLAAIPGQPVDASSRPSGCPFRSRCAHALPACVETPALVARRAPDHLDACILDLAAKAQERPAAAVTA